MVEALFSGNAEGAVAPDRLFLLAAIPAFNEAKTIGSLVLAARDYVDEVVVVDDGSTDHSAWIAERAGARVIQHNRNRGYGAAIRTCFDYARKKGVDVLVVLDGDGQHRPECIPRLVKPVVQGYADLCIGSRFLEWQSTRNVPLYRRFGIKLLTAFTNLGNHQNGKIRDAQSGFRAYSRAAIDAIDPRETGMGASAEILWDADRRGLRIEEVPIAIDYDVQGSSKGSLRHGVSVIASMLRYVEAEHPLTFIAVPGLVLFLTGVGLGAYFLSALGGNGAIQIGTLFVTLIVAVFGLLLGFTGLIMHAVVNASRRART